MSKLLIYIAFIIICSQNIYANGAFDGYSCSKHSLEEYLERYNEVSNDTDDVSPILWSFYCASQNNLQEFKNRYNEIINTGNLYDRFIFATYFYAVSQYSLNEFVNRIEEIGNDRGNVSNIFYGNYAASKNNLHEFKRRYNEISAIPTFQMPDHFWGSYAASQYTLEEFKSRIMEIQGAQTGLSMYYY